MSSFCEAMANVSPDTLLEFGGFEYYTVLVTDGTSEHTLLVAEVYSAIGDGIAWTSRVHPDETPDDDESQGAEDEEPAMEILS
jgi:hypothetical protein